MKLPIPPRFAGGTRRRWRTRGLLGAAVLGLGAALPGAHGQAIPIPMGKSIHNLEKPFTNDAGELEYRISGSEATRKSINRIAVTDLKIELFKEGKEDMVITSPQADFWETKGLLSTRHTVKIDRGDMIITADTIQWELEPEKGVLRKNVRVEITSFDMGATGGTGVEGSAMSGGTGAATDLTAPPSVIQPSPGASLLDGGTFGVDPPGGLPPAEGAPPSEPDFDPSLFNR